MVKRMVMGAKPDGTQGVRISSPGTDVDLLSSPPIFDTSALYAQALFSAYVPVHQTMESTLIPVGANPADAYWVDIYTFSGSYIFPYALPFKPTCFILYDVHDENRPTPRGLYLTGFLPIWNKPYNDGVTFGGEHVDPQRYQTEAPTYYTYGAYVVVTNIPVG
ncbi:MAG: hypothetical protein V7704_19450 [Aurantimonas endophytica]|uniref:hypothetical protein n=1 Tax=Aurantimonas endophytica TaxID=1522175 RepID=UPI003002D2F9